MGSFKPNETMTEAVKTANNYHDWVFETFSNFIKRGIAIEIGPGHGKFTRKIINHVDKLIVSDIDQVAVDKITNELRNLKEIKYLVMNGIEEDKLKEQVDNIILINLLEHIENDTEFISQCYKSLKHNGKLILFLPAFELLYSELDKQAGHFRRYTKKKIINLLNKNGFRINKIRYFNSIGFFGWLVNKYTKSKLNSKTTNVQVVLYDKMIPILKHFDYLLFFIGQSLVVLATKKE